MLLHCGKLRELLLEAHPRVMDALCDDFAQRKLVAENTGKHGRRNGRKKVETNRKTRSRDGRRVSGENAIEVLK